MEEHLLCKIRHIIFRQEIANYDVKLKIRDLVGCEDSVTKQDVKIRKPVAV
jgi:hypothetical protein